jgi:hypothetical protein
MRTVKITTLALLLLGAAHARAEGSANDRSLAQSLFDQAKRLMAAGDYEHACPKLEESQKLDPGGGTLLNLALCHEKQGKVAMAWTEFKEALSAAKRDGREERVTAAQQHITALEPKLPWLTLNVEKPADGENVELDGASLGRAAWGSPVAIDPGTHELHATAPNRQAWTGSFTIVIAEKKSVPVPELVAAAAASGAAAATAEPGAEPSVQQQTQEPARGSKTRTLGWVIGGAGVVATGVGVYFGIDTFKKKKQSDDECPTDTTCSAHGVELNNQAHTSAWISNIGIGLGIVGIGVGTYLVITGNRASAQQTGRWTLDATPLAQGGALRLRGTW